MPLTEVSPLRFLGQILTGVVFSGHGKLKAKKMQDFWLVLSRSSHL
jgi:hypothetical protein